MNSDLPLTQRKNLRIPKFDYAQPGAYFVTIVTQDRQKIFGQIIDMDVELSDVGKMVKEVIDQIPGHYLGVNVELFVIMPNHVHLLLLITNVAAGLSASVAAGLRAGVVAGPRAGVVASPRAGVVAGPRACQSDHIEDGQPQGVDPTKEQLSLPEIVHRIKSLTTHRYSIGVNEKGWPRFEKRLWQRNYYEHVIRNERDYQAVFDYILNNPRNWEMDEEFSNS